MNIGGTETGVVLATPIDRDNSDSFSRLPEIPSKHYNVKDLMKRIDHFGEKHANFLGFKNLENNMCLLVATLSKLGGIDPLDPDCSERRIELELEVKRLIPCFEQQMAFIRLCAINDEDNLVALEKDFSYFIMLYRIEKIRVSQILDRHQPNVFGVSIPTFGQVTAAISNEQLKTLEDHGRHDCKHRKTVIEQVEHEIRQLQPENKYLMSTQSMVSLQLERTKDLTSKITFAMTEQLKLQGVQQNKEKDFDEKKREIFNMEIRSKLPSLLKSTVRSRNITPDMSYENNLEATKTNNQPCLDLEQSAECSVKSLLDHRLPVSSMRNQVINNHSYQREINQRMISRDDIPKELKKNPSLPSVTKEFWGSNPYMSHKREHVHITPIVNSEADLFCIDRHCKVKDSSELDFPYLVDSEEGHHISELIFQPEDPLPTLKSHANNMRVCLVPSCLERANQPIIAQDISVNNNHATPESRKDWGIHDVELATVFDSYLEYPPTAQTRLINTAASKSTSVGVTDMERNAPTQQDSRAHRTLHKFCFDPGGLSVFQCLQECSFVYQVCIKKNVKTDEGHFPCSHVATCKLIKFVHLDIMDQLVMKSHHSILTEKIMVKEEFGSCESSVQSSS